MTKKMRKRVGSIALATVLTVTMLPQGSFVEASRANDEIAVNVDATLLNASGTQYEGKSGQSGLNYTLVNQNGNVSGSYSNSFDANYDSTNKYDGNDLGCVYTKESTTFKVWSPTASKVILCRYTTGTDGEKGAKKIEEKEMTKGSGNVWSCKVDGDIVNTYYTYKVTNNGNTSEAVDIYAKAVGANGQRAMVVDLDSTDPKNWDTDYKRSAQKISDVITWEVHVNDFSNQGSQAGFSDENRGKYLAFTEDGTKLSGTDYETGIAYLKKLGITHVQILPMYDYGSVDETKAGQTDSNYNWGYDPVNFNAPEGSYSTNPYDGNVRINEMKQMIQALHDAGIKVIMDVVYNHTYVKGNQEMAFFDDIVPGYYYRSNSQGYTNGSGCGNEVRTQAYMANKFIRESMLYWASEYNLDGFRLDLMGLYDTTTIKDIRNDMDAAFGKDTMVIYGEGWGCGVQYEDCAGKWNSWTLADSNIGLFNDSGRDCIHGTANAEHVGQIGMLQQNISTGKGVEGDKYPLSLYGMIQGAAGRSQDQWWMWRAYCYKNSDQSITYSSCHDNMALWDKLAETIKDNGTLVKLNKMNAGILFSCHGGTFIQAGEEFGRSKDGIENSYSSGAKVNQLDWTRVKDYNEIVEFYKGMIGIRKAFSGFRTVYTSASENLPANSANGGFQNVGNNNMTNVEGFNDCSNSVIHKIGFYLSNNVSGEWNKIAVLMNNDTTDATATLSGASSWVLVSNGKKASVEGVETVNSNKITVPGKSVVVAVPKDTFDANPNVGKTNAAPTITVDNANLEVAPGESVSFTVTAKDADGDKVTLSASDLPKGAEFDATTGVFTWDSATKGTHTVTFTATDGTAKSSKEVTIKVSSATASLEELVAEIEAANLSKDDFTEQVFSNLQTALDNAKNLIEQSNPSEEDYRKASNALQSAYDKVKEEKTARENLKAYVETATKEIDNADSSVDADLLKDAKEVLKEAETLLNGTAKAMAYTFAQDNLTDSVNALATVGMETGIHVSTSFSNPYIYIWTGSGTSAKKLAGEWPGTALKEKDAEGNYFYDLPAEGTYNVIINDGLTGKKQTQDLTGNEGSILITVAGSSSSTDDNGNAIYTAETKKVSDGGSAPEITKESLNSVIETAKKYDSEAYTEDSYEALETQITEAEKVAGDKDATQLIINQQARALRAAILSLVATKEDVIDPTVSPTETTAPPVKTEEPTETPDAATDPTTVPGTTDDGKSPTPSASVKPSPTPDSSSEPSQTSSVTETALPQSTASLTPGTNVPGNVNTPTDSAVNGQVSDLKIKSVSCNPVLCQVVNKNVKISVAAEGGTGSQQYKFEIYKGSKLVTSSEYNNSNTFVYKASSAGTYTFKVYVKDEHNVEVSKTKKFIFVSKALSLKISKRVAKKKVTLTVSASGGLKSYKYKYVIKNAKGKTVKKTGFVSKKKLIWKPTKKGTYKVTITVKDSTGTTKSKTITVKKK